MSATKSDSVDLAQGIPIAALAEGSIIKGRFLDKEVILVHLGGRYHALEAECTHMGAPLAEGAIVGDCIHCPWHHARFSLATGEAIAAPAFSALQRYLTKVQGDRVYVVAPLPQTEPPAPVPSKASRVVIVGAGASGFACAEWLARRGASSRVTLIGDDRDGSYDRTMCSKQYLIGMNERVETMMPDLLCDTNRLAARVERIDPARKQLYTDTGANLTFDVLVLATGAVPHHLQAPGFDRSNVFTLRNLEDADAIIEAARGARRVAIIGASFIGLEAAASLRQRHLDVAVIAPDRIPLQNIIGAEAGAMIRQVHEQKGIRFFLEREVRGFDGTRVLLDHGTTVDADFVVLGLGVAPDTRLAEAAGIACLPAEQGGGIVVDEYLATSAPGIFAAGDIAAYPDLRSGKRIRVEHWVHAQRQGQYLARALLGKGDRFLDEPFFWSAHFDTGLRYVGHVSKIIRAEVNGSIAERSFTMRLAGIEREAAFITCNRDLPSLLIEADWEHRLRPK